MAKAGLPWPSQRTVRSIPALAEGLQEPLLAAAAPEERLAGAVALEERLGSAAPVREGPRGRAAKPRRTAEDPSRPEREASIADGPAILILRLESQDDRRRLGAASDHSAPGSR